MSLFNVDVFGMSGYYTELYTIIHICFPVGSGIVTFHCIVAAAGRGGELGTAMPCMLPTRDCLYVHVAPCFTAQHPRKAAKQTPQSVGSACASWVTLSAT